MIGFEPLNICKSIDSKLVFSSNSATFRQLHLMKVSSPINLTLDVTMKISIADFSKAPFPIWNRLELESIRTYFSLLQPLNEKLSIFESEYGREISSIEENINASLLIFFKRLSF